MKKILHVIDEKSSINLKYDQIKDNVQDIIENNRVEKNIKPKLLFKVIMSSFLIIVTLVLGINFTIAFFNNQKTSPINNQDNPSQEVVTESHYKYSEVYGKNENSNLVHVDISNVNYETLVYENEDNNYQVIILEARVIENYFYTNDNDDFLKDSLVYIPLVLDNNYNVHNLKELLVDDNSFIVYINNLNDELSFKNGEEDINYYLVADPIIISKNTFVPINEDKVRYDLLNENNEETTNEESNVDLLIEDGASLDSIEETVKEEFGEQTVNDPYSYTYFKDAYIDHIEENVCYFVNDDKPYYFNSGFFGDLNPVLYCFNILIKNGKNYLQYYNQIESTGYKTGMLFRVDNNHISILYKNDTTQSFELDYLIEVKYKDEIIDLKDVPIYSNIEFTSALGKINNRICHINVLKMAETVVTKTNEIAICKTTDEGSITLKQYQTNNLPVKKFYVHWDEIEIKDLEGNNISRFGINAAYVLKLYYDRTFDGYNTWYSLTSIEFIDYNTDELEVVTYIRYFWKQPLPENASNYIRVGIGDSTSQIYYENDNIFVDADDNPIDKYSLQENDKLEISAYLIDKVKQVFKIKLLEKAPNKYKTETLNNIRITLAKYDYDGDFSYLTFNNSDDKEEKYISYGKIVDSDGNKIDHIYTNDTVNIIFDCTYKFGVWKKSINTIVLVERAPSYLITLYVSKSEIYREYEDGYSTFTLPVFKDEDGNNLSWYYYDSNNNKIEVQDSFVVEKELILHLDDKTNFNFTYGDEVIIKDSLYNYDNIDTLIVPNTLFGKPVTKIEKLHMGVYNNIIVEENIEIGSTAFSYNNAKTITVLGNGIIYPGSAAFNGCKAETIDFCDNEVVLPAGIFDHCKNLTTIKSKKLILGDVTNAFSYCTSLKSITVEGHTVGKACFSNCTSLETLNIDDIISIDDYGFYNCPKLTNLDLSHVETIGAQAFYQSALTEINLPNVVSIGLEAFKSSSRLQRVIIGNKVESINSRILYNCNNVSYLEVPFLGMGNVHAVAYYFEYYVNLREWSYSSTDCYCRYTNEITKQEITTRIPRSLKEVVVTNEDYIHAYAFIGMDAIEHVTYLKEVVMIENEAFRDAFIQLTFTGDTSNFDENWNLGIVYN